MRNEEAAVELLAELYKVDFEYKARSDYAKGVRDALEALVDSNIQYIDPSPITIMQIYKKLIKEEIIDV